MNETVTQKLLEVIPHDKVYLIKSIVNLEYHDDDYKKFWDDLRIILVREIGDERTEHWQQRAHSIYHWYMQQDIMNRMKL